MGARVTFFVLSEDSGQQGWSALHQLVYRTLELVGGQLDRHQGVAVMPRDEVPVEVQKICSGNRWRSSNPADMNRKGQLFRYVAARLAESALQEQFVMFHVDADRVWSERGRNPSRNVDQFEEVRTGVKRVLMEPAGRPHKRVRSEAEVDALMQRLSLIVPYYSIESWLYQATDRACELCRARSCGRHLAAYESWKQDRGALDEIEKLKDQAELCDLHCLGDKDKEALARGFPANDVFGADKSYGAWLQQLMADASMMQALALARYG